MFEHNVYVITGGPVGRNIQDIREQLGQQAIYVCKIQNFRRITQADEPTPVPTEQPLPASDRKSPMANIDGEKTIEFRRTFAHPTRLTVEFSPKLVLPPVNDHSEFTAQLICHARYACEPDAIAAKDPLLSVLQPDQDIYLDYICNRGIGIVQRLSWSCDWHRDYNVAPHLLTAINLNTLQDSLKVIDLSGHVQPHLSTHHHLPDQYPLPDGQINDPPAQLRQGNNGSF